MSRPSHFEVESAFEAVEASRAAGWPEPGGAYNELVNAELTATRITHLGGIPGVLLDMDSVRKRQEKTHMPPEIVARNNRLHQARQIIATERLAQGELAQSAILSTHAVMPVFEVAPERAAPQLEKLVDAAFEGWEIRAVRPIEFTDAMPPNTQSLILIGNPEDPDAVYWQATDTSKEPHESWSTAPKDTVEAAVAYMALADVALPTHATTAMHLQMQQHFAIADVPA